MKAQLSAHDLHRTFHVGHRRIDALRGVSLGVAKGETVFLVGPSGAGKTTLLYTLAGLERPDSGDVAFEGESIYHRSAKRQAELRNRKMGFVFQSFFLLPELTALENVLLPSIIQGRSAATQAHALLERVGLEGRAHHLPAELSGGEQQRVAIARSLINDPVILFADEPTGNLDDQTSQLVVNLLLALTRETGRTLVVVTHDTRLAQRGDRKLEIRDGTLADAAT